MPLPDDAWDALMERAAILEYDGSLAREQATQRAWELTACQDCEHWRESACKFGCTMRDCVMLGDEAEQEWQRAFS